MRSLKFISQLMLLSDINHHYCDSHQTSKNRIKQNGLKSINHNWTWPFDTTKKCDLLTFWHNWETWPFDTTEKGNLLTFWHNLWPLTVEVRGPLRLLMAAEKVVHRNHWFEERSHVAKKAQIISWFENAKPCLVHLICSLNLCAFLLKVTGK